MTASYVLKKVPLTELYLDPNNPRYSELGEGTRKVPEGRVREDGVQRKARERLALANLELDKLQDSIRTVGFLPIDPMIVVPLPDAHSYMVIEGNRRLAALKQVAEDQESGEIDLDPSIFKTIRTVNVLVVDSEDEQERNHLARVFQGVRHVSGVKPWGPYQQAGLISSMSDDGRSMQDIKEALGLSAKRINVLHKVYSAIQQMGKDPEYGDDAKPVLFSHFEEALSRAAVSQWLGWNNEESRFDNLQNLHEFYSWVVGPEVDGEKLVTKITDAKDLRRLPTLMDNPVQFENFRENPHLTLRDAVSGLGAGEDSAHINWRGILSSNLSTLQQIPAIDVESASEADMALLKEVRAMCDKILKLVQAAA